MPSLVSPTSLLRPPRAKIAFSEPVCMVIPPSVFLLDERVFMSLGILKVAACLDWAGSRGGGARPGGHREFFGRRRAALSRKRDSHRRSDGHHAPASGRRSNCSERIRRIRPDIKVILGGPHVTLVHSAVKLERKLARVGRAHFALARLESAFDVRRRAMVSSRSFTPSRTARPS